MRMTFVRHIFCFLTVFATALPVSALDLTGTFTGKATASNGTVGPVTLVMTQTGSAVSGHGTFFYESLNPAAAVLISGTVNGDAVALTLTDNDGSCPKQFTVTVTQATSYRISGNYTKHGGCADTTVTGSFVITKYNCTVLSTLACPVFTTGLLAPSGCNETRDLPEPGIYFNDIYEIQATAGQTLTISVSSHEIDAYVYLYFDSTEVAEDDNSAGGSDARVTYTVPTSGRYRIKVSSRHPLSEGAYGLGVSACDGSSQATPRAYITNASGKSVSVIDTAVNTVIATVPVEGTADGVAVNPALPRVYVTHYDSNSVSVIDTTRNSVIAKIPVGIRPFGVAVNAVGTRAYVANTFDNSLSVIDTATNAVIDTIDVPGAGVVFAMRPRGVAVNPAGTRVYVANNGDGTLSVIDTGVRKQIAAISTGTPYDSPYGVALNPAGTRAYVVNNQGPSLAVVDTSKNAVVATVSLPSSPWFVALSPEGKRAYVTCGDSDFSGSVVVIDTATNTVITTVTSSALFSRPYGIGISGDGSRAYVAVGESNAVAVIDTAANKVLTTISVGSAPSAFGLFISTPSATPQLTPPIVTSAPASEVLQTTAVLNGSVNPNGKTATAYFQWGLSSPAYGNTTPARDVGSGTSPVTLNAGLTALTCGTLYHFRAIATNSDGATSGSDQVFTTSACSSTAPAVIGVTPSSGTTAGGTHVTVSGSGFASGATVLFGGTVATNVSVANSATITCVTPAHAAGSAAVQVTNPNGQSGQLPGAFTFANALPSLPVITRHPASQTVPIGTNATFSIAASGTPAPTFQWQVSTNTRTPWTDLSNTPPYSGVTTVTLTVSGVTTALSGLQFRCVAANSAGSAASAPATLTVTSAGSGAFSQQAKLVDPTGLSNQGIAVSISADGDTAVVGSTGGVAVWTRRGGAWSYETTLRASDEVGTSQQGQSVCIAADGNTIIAGGPMDNDHVGAAWVWTKSSGRWTQQGPKLVGTGGVGNNYQGTSVSLSADGNTAIVGGNMDSAAHGAAWVWTRSGAVWSQQGPKLVGSGAVGADVQQGMSVALSADGNTAIVGGFADSIDRGAVWVWIRNGGTWTQQGPKLVASSAVGDPAQGWSVSLSADGNTAIVGGPAFDRSNGGKAWIWRRYGGAWSQGPDLVGTDAVGYAAQGFSVALSSDGNTALVGGTADNSEGQGALGQGAVWVWRRDGDFWRQQGTKLVGSEIIGTGIEQGRSVAVSADGTTLIVGGPFDQNGRGAAWIFTANPPRRRAARP